MLGGVLSRNLSGSNNNTSNIVYAFFLLIIMAIIQYGIAMAWPEFFLLAYCKFRFAIFNEKMSKTLLTEVKNSKSPKKNLQGIKEGLNRWYNKPLLALKSFAGWKVGKKAPISVLVLVWAEISAVVYILYTVLFLFRIIVSMISINKMINELSTLFLPILMLGFVIEVIIIILLKFIKAISNK